MADIGAQSDGMQLCPATAVAFQMEFGWTCTVTSVAGVGGTRRSNHLPGTTGREAVARSLPSRGGGSGNVGDAMSEVSLRVVLM